MRSLKNFLSAGLLMSAFVFTNLNAYVPESEIALAGGWRDDELRARMNGSNLANPATIENTVKFKNINVWQIGLQGRLAMPESCCCERWWLNQLFLDGSAYWGWVTSGNTKSLSNLTFGTGALTGVNLPHIDDGHTYDYDVALGWLYPLSCEFGIGPRGGYSWDRISVRSKDSVVRYHSTWKSPFLGFELDYSLCEWFFDAGYEYHWTHWNGGFSNNDISDDFSNATGTVSFFDARNSSKTGRGHVGYVDAEWRYNSCFGIILGFKYTYFKTRGESATANGMINQPVEAGNSLNGISFAGPVGHNSWQSYRITLDAVYYF